MSVPMYKLYPNDYMYNTQTKRHTRKSGKVFRRMFAANPAIFVESGSILPPMNVPARVPERQPEPLPPPPAIGDAIPVPEHVLTQEEIKNQVSQRAQEKVREIIETELKDNPNPYKGKQSQELEQMLRAFIHMKLAEAEEARSKKTKPKPVRKIYMPKFVVQDQKDESLDEENSDDYDDPDY